MARKITCTNDDNISVVFTDKFAPWLLETCEGIYETKNNVSTSANTMTDGSTFMGSTALMRNIVLTMRDKPKSDHQSNRAILYSLFKPKSEGVFQYEENNIVRTIKYYVESVLVDGEKRSRRATVSLLCPDPFFEDKQDINVKMAGWAAGFEFQHAFLEAGEPFGTRTVERLKTITNYSAADNIGITITVEAEGPVNNISITHVENGESIEIGTAGNPLSMQAGDKVIITTHINNKHVYLESGGIREEINEYLSEDSVFLQLNHGENTFGYSAESGEEYMLVTISYRYRYLGA